MATNTARCLTWYEISIEQIQNPFFHEITIYFDEWKKQLEISFQIINQIINYYYSND